MKNKILIIVLLTITAFAVSPTFADQSNKKNNKARLIAECQPFPACLDHQDPLIVDGFVVELSNFFNKKQRSQKQSSSNKLKKNNQ